MHLTLHPKNLCSGPLAFFFQHAGRDGYHHLAAVLPCWQCKEQHTHKREGIPSLAGRSAYVWGFRSNLIPLFHAGTQKTYTRDSGGLLCRSPEMSPDEVRRERCSPPPSLGGPLRIPSCRPSGPCCGSSTRRAGRPLPPQCGFLDNLSTGCWVGGWGGLRPNSQVLSLDEAEAWLVSCISFSPGKFVSHVFCFLVSSLHVTNWYHYLKKFPTGNFSENFSRIFLHPQNCFPNYFPFFF